MPYSVKGFFEIDEDMVQILLVLEVLFTQDSEVEDLFCGASSSSEPSLFFSNYFFSLGFKPMTNILAQIKSKIAPIAKIKSKIALIAKIKSKIASKKKTHFVRKKYRFSWLLESLDVYSQRKHRATVIREFPDNIC